MRAAEGGGEPAPRRWRRLPRPPAPVARLLSTVALCYLTALVAVNLSTGPTTAGFIDRILPHVGASTLDGGSIAAEWETIDQRYVIRGVSPSSATGGAEQGIVQYLHDTYNDRFSAYLTPSQYQQLTSTLGGVRSGSIGIAVEPRCAAESICAANQTPSEVVIEDVLSGQPADRAGIRRNDVLVAVDGTALSSLGSNPSAQIDRSASLVRGPVGTTVNLTVRRDGSLLTIRVTRENLHIPSVYSTLMGSVLYMQVTGFDTDTSDAARAQLQQGIASGARSIILDLRENGGGYVSAAQSLVSEFVAPTAAQKDVVVRRGRLAASESPGSAEQVTHDAILGGGVALTEPMVVLVNGDTASAAEITTAALRDYHRATVVGEKTFGKGSVQVDFPLPDGADLHLTVERWYGPDGENIDGNGIQPGTAATLASPDDRYRLDAQSPPAAGDAQLQAALAALAA
ncbi:MAG: S41 family peptidase [Candidatus Dormibacteria bacterium]